MPTAVLRLADLPVGSIKALIFDLDDTLCDYAGAKRRGFELVSTRLTQRGHDAADFWPVYESDEPKLFARFAAGEITREEYRRRRFLGPLSKLGIAEPQLADELSALYMSAANGRVALFADASRVLQSARAAGKRIGLLTNGPSDGQRQKIAKLGLDVLVDAVAISEELGFGKPDPRAFRAVAEMLRVQTRDCLMVGDSLDVDVRGAARAGMHAALLGASSADMSTLVMRELAELERWLLA